MPRFGFDPLRRVITDHVDFDLVRTKSPVELLIAATHVATGRARLFRHDEISIEAVLASACLPVLLTFTAKKPNWSRTPLRRLLFCRKAWDNARRKALAPTAHLW